jgi:hypothetical protein
MRAILVIMDFFIVRFPGDISYLTDVYHTGFVSGSCRKIVRGIQAKPHEKGAREAQPQPKMIAAKMLKRYKRKRGREKQMLKAESRKLKFLTADDADHRRWDANTEKIIAKMQRGRRAKIFNGMLE